MALLTALLPTSDFGMQGGATVDKASRPGTVG